MSAAPLILRALLALLLAAVAGVAQLGLQRLERLLPARLERRAAARGHSAAHTARGRQLVGAATACAQLALWGGALFGWSALFPELMRRRDAIALAVQAALARPLVVWSGRELSAGDLLLLPLLALALWLAAGVVASLVKSHLLRSAGASSGLQESVALVLRFVLMSIGGLVLLHAWGVDLRSIAVAASVLGVGIGFGLQHLANNVASGLVLGLERPVQQGDFVKVGEHLGTVQRIRARITEIRTLDGVTILIPNSRFLEQEVVNWSHGDPPSQLHVPVALAYGSDLARGRAALLEAARSHPDVLAEPRPEVRLGGFGEFALELDLLVWVRAPERQLRIQSDLRYRIEERLRQHGLSIPFPQRELRLRAPRLERLLEAWARERLPGEDLAEEPKPLPPLAGQLEPAIDGLAPRGWSEAALEAVVARMRRPDGISRTDRRHLFTVYPCCFVGREAVAWMRRELRLSREEALELGRLLAERGRLRHVLDEHPFSDANLFYRFREDEEIIPARASA